MRSMRWIGAQMAGKLPVEGRIKRSEYGDIKKSMGINPDHVQMEWA